ncbi:hypothetical protein M513_02088 [Trichuris suis]|uniref:Uncharacterized protein n=1 Tax=Trichuris suis TaxID=68888 RepID=A0A085MJ07_9BILA|nr:hypothetical protein M513_02088 [Trichuris suis]
MQWRAIPGQKLSIQHNAASQRTHLALSSDHRLMNTSKPGIPGYTKFDGTGEVAPWRTGFSGPESGKKLFSDARDGK